MTNLIAKRLAEARTKMGLSQKQLGIKAGIDPFSASPRINQYERGKHTPDFGTVERLAKVLKTPVPFFYTKDNELAKLILIYASLSGKNKKRAVSEISNFLT